MPAVRRVGAPLAWAGLLVAVLVAGAALDRGALASPGSVRPDVVAGWAADRHPLDVAFALALVAVRLAAAYLLGAGVLVAAARALGWARGVRVADALALPAVRRVVHGALGAGVAATLVAGSGGVAAVVARPTPVAVVAQVDPPGHDDAPILRLLEEPGPPVLRRLPDDSLPAQPPPTTPTTSTVGSTQAAWTVVPGDHLWSVAERVLASAWDRAPTEAEVAPYWGAVVEANRDRLADPSNPDLLFAGQALALPPAPPSDG